MSRPGMGMNAPPATAKLAPNTRSWSCSSSKRERTERSTQAHITSTFSTVSWPNGGRGFKEENRRSSARIDHAPCTMSDQSRSFNVLQGLLLSRRHLSLFSSFLDEKVRSQGRE